MCGLFIQSLNSPNIIFFIPDNESSLFTFIPENHGSCFVGWFNMKALNVIIFAKVTAVDIEKHYTMILFNLAFLFVGFRLMLLSQQRHLLAAVTQNKEKTLSLRPGPSLPMTTKCNYIALMLSFRFCTAFFFIFWQRTNHSSFALTLIINAIW